MNKSTNHSQTRLTPRGDATREKIMRFLKDNQVVICPVSIGDIAEETGISQTSVFHHLEILTRLGKIKRPDPKESPSGNWRRKYNHIEILISEESMLTVMRPISAMESSFLVKWLVKNEKIKEGKFVERHFLKFNVGGVIAELKEAGVKVSEEDVLIATRRLAVKK